MESNVKAQKNNRFSSKKKMGTEMYLLFFIVAILAILYVTTKDFFTPNNLISILNYFSYMLIAAIGMNIIIITSNIDVSAGGIISVICITIAAVGKLDTGIVVFLPVAMFVGAMLSLINGLFIRKLKIPSIVATLATTQLFAGILPLLIEGSIYDLPASFTWLAFQAKIFKIIPVSIVFMLIVSIIAILFMKYSRFSKKLYAIGNNEHGARLAGINVDKTIIIAYVIAGCLFGITATIIATAGQRVTTTMGTGLEMTFIAAVVLGGTPISGGTGKILGTVFGALILAIIAPAINYLGISSDWSDAIMGVIILVSVIVGSLNIAKKKTGPSDTDLKVEGGAIND